MFIDHIGHFQLFPLLYVPPNFLTTLLFVINNCLSVSSISNRYMDV